MNSKRSTVNDPVNNNRRSQKNSLTSTKNLTGTNSKLAACALALSFSFAADAGFQVSGTQLLDDNGNPFIMRGVNHPHAWYTNRTQQAFADIASVGANAVRVVLADGQQWTRTSATEVVNIIQWAKDNQLVTILEVHDATGWGEQSTAGTVFNATSYWIDIANALQGQEDYVIINIANEPFGNGVPASTWIDQHVEAIQRLRAAGLTHTLIIDAANWGQDWQEIMFSNASTVAAADTLNNTMFSVHMYEVYQNRSSIENYVSSFLSTHRLPLIVGEFGADHYGQSVDENSIMAVAEQYNIGYLGWSWSGNSSEVASLDITNNWNVNSLSPWGDRLINGADGIRETAEIASVFEGVSSSSSSSQSSSSSSSISSSLSSSSSSSSSSVSSSSPASGEECNWYGTYYPLCVTTQEGWGWESNRSCIARTTCGQQPDPWGIESPNTPSSSSSSIAVSSSSSSSSSSVNSVSSSSSIFSSTSSSSSSSSSSSVPVGGSCEYVVTNDWNGGFTAAIRITNSGSSVVNGWNVSWNYSDGSRVTNLWNANLSGSNPYSASNLGWNGSIQPGQTVEFGFQGTSTAGTQTPSVTGAICNP
jgi:mannan endo-1,4-beta-mannosidase